MYIKLLSTGACANITIREIMLINIISSASWTLQRPIWIAQSFQRPVANIRFAGLLLFFVTRTNTNRYKASFLPSALSVFNENYTSH